MANLNLLYRVASRSVGKGFVDQRDQVGRAAPAAPRGQFRGQNAYSRADGLGAHRGALRGDALTSEPSLREYHLLPSVRGDLLAKLGRFDEAHTEFERAASFARNERERTLLAERAAECARIGARAR